MQLFIWLIAQAPAVQEPASFVGLLAQFGMTGAVLVLAFGFLWYLQRRDERDSAERTRRDQSIDKLASNLDDLATSINRLEVLLESKLSK